MCYYTKFLLKNNIFCKPASNAVSPDINRVHIRSEPGKTKGDYQPDAYKQRRNFPHAVASQAADDNAER